MIPSEHPDLSGHSDAGCLHGQSPFIEKSALRLPESKSCLIEFMVADLRQSIARAEEALTQLESPDDRTAAGRTLAEIGDATARIARFFEFESMAALCETLARCGAQGGAGRLSDRDLAQAIPRVCAIVELLREQADGLAWGTVIRRPVNGLCDSLQAIVAGTPLASARMLPHGATAQAALVADGVVPAESSPVATEHRQIAQPPESVNAAPSIQRAPEIPAAHAHPGDSADSVDEFIPALPIVHPPVFAFDPAETSTHIHLADTAPNHAPITRAAPPTPTPPVPPPELDAVSIPADRLDALLGLVGDLSMQNDRLTAVASAAHSVTGGGDRLASITGSVARVAADLRDAVLDTRMVTLHHLFARLRMIAAERAESRGKRISLSFAGEQERIDCALASRLADPLGELVRAMVDFGVETPRERAAAGKPDIAAIAIHAGVENGTLALELTDDGRGVSRRRIARKALRLGLTDERTLQSMTDEDVYALIFTSEYSADDAPGLHAAQVEIAALGGSITLTGADGRGATMIVRTPVEALTTPALLIEVGDATFALPVADIDQVVRPAADALTNSPSGPSLRLNGRVLPIVDAAALLGISHRTASSAEEHPTLVVLAHASDAVALQITRAIGTRDIVVRPIDHALIGSAPIRGGTIRSQPDGDAVTLVIDTRKALARVHLAQDQIRTAA